MESPRFGERLNQWIYSGIPVGRVKGIGVSVHLALVLVVFFWLVWSFAGPSPMLGLLDTAIMTVVLFGSVLAHELGHCYGAHRVGGKSEHILLWPLGGLATLSGAEKSPHDEFIVVLLGPLVSLGLALFASVGVWIMPDWAELGAMGTVTRLALEHLFFLNWMLFIFNMVVPLFPMDSARLVRALFSMKHDAQNVTYNVCLGGIFVAGLMCGLYFVGLWSPIPGFGETRNIFILLIAMFGLQSCFLQMRALKYNYVYTGTWSIEAPYAELGRRLAEIFHLPRRRPRAARSAPMVRREAEIVAIASDDPDISEREELEADLRGAIESEDFVRAAEIRDRLSKMSAESPKS